MNEVISWTVGDLICLLFAMFALGLFAGIPLGEYLEGHEH